MNPWALGPLMPGWYFSTHWEVPTLQRGCCPLFPKHTGLEIVPLTIGVWRTLPSECLWVEKELVVCVYGYELGSGEVRLRPLFLLFKPREAKYVLELPWGPSQS